MATPIDREQVLYQLERLMLAAMLDDECEEETIKRCIAAVKLVPTLTPPEIVCCQDCVHHEDGYAHWCNKWEHTCPDDSEFFCKFGRKKNDSTTD